MNKIEITVLSARVLDALSVRGLKAKTVREFERYGTRRIVQHCLDNGQTIYFKETVQDFVWQERARMESGALPHYQWVLTRRAAVYLDQMAKHGKVQGEPLRSWEAEHNPLFQNAPHSPSNSMKVIDIICRTRDAVIQLELSDKTKTNYIYCGFGPILNFFASRGEEFYSPETLALFVNKAKENYANGTIPKASFQTMRKAARWIEECLSTGRVSQRKLRKYNFACAPPEFENLLSQYQLYMGMRDYAMIMLAYTTGLRGCDIVNLKFNSIDWDACELRLVQEKTNIPVSLPLDTTTGNAIADYILNARPKCDSEYVFLRTQRPYTKLRSMWTVIAKYARIALGKSRRMNGPHAFRRGMGRQLLEADIPAPLICDILGHTSSMSLRQYTASSLEKLKVCAGTISAIPIEQETLL